MVKYISAPSVDGMLYAEVLFIQGKKGTEMMKGIRVICIVLSILLLMTMGGVSAFAKTSPEPAAGAENEESIEATQADSLDEEQQVTEEFYDNESGDKKGAEKDEGEDEGEPGEGDIDLSDGKGDIEEIEDQQYTGQPVEPAVVVTYDGQVIDPENYDVTYSNNIELTEEALVTVTGKGVYTGTLEETFEIVETIEPKKLKKVKNLRAIAGYKSIILKWDPVEGADDYWIMRNDKKIGDENGKWPRRLSVIKDYNKIWDKVKEKPYWANVNKGTVEENKKYTYKVYAVKYDKADDEEATWTTPVEVKSSAARISKRCVSRMKVAVTIRQGTTLTSTDGKSRYTVHSGQRIITEGYGGGKYYFKRKGHWFRVLNTRTGSQRADYTKAYEYSKTEAEYFINNKNLTYARPGRSKKNYFIWVSLYTQQVHVFKKSGGKWKQVEHWDCSSGAASSPSPTGNKMLHRKIYGRHAIKHWNCYSTLNAIHGIKPVQYAGYDWTRYLGEVKSMGCVRSPNSKAAFVWNKCPIGTKVLMY